jgi:hypothetical protein
MKPRVYVETSVFGYLTARDSASLVGSSRQLLTRRWWDRRHEFDLFVSELVIRECKDGDEQAAARRMEAVSGLPLLSLTPQAADLATLLITQNVMPAKALEFQAYCQPGHTSKDRSKAGCCGFGTAVYLPTGRTTRRRR